MSLNVEQAVQALQQQVQMLLQQQQQAAEAARLQQQQQQAAAAARQAADAEMDPVEEEDDEDPGAPADWSSVLGVPRASPGRADALTLCQLFSSPPPLGQVKVALQESTKYEGVPPTPPPRGNRLDKQIWTTQHKLEAAMNLMVAQLETNDAARMAMAGAMIRSAWEDLNENRRRLMAGRQTYTLDQRKDMDQTRLLSTEEAEKVRKARSAKATAPATQGKGNQAPRQWKPDWNTQGQGNWRKSGKGQGKGKGQKEQK